MNQTHEKSFDITTLNLDCMTQSELHAFVAFCGNGVRPVAAAAKLFGSSSRRGSVRTTTDLRNYAWNKLTAISCRLRGEIETAQQYEAICERIYERLPDGTRW